MSGVKRIMVDQAQWSEAQRAAARLRDVNREIPAMIEALRRDQQAAADRVVAQVSARQDGFDRALVGLSDQARRMEARTSQRLRAQAEQLRQVREDATRARSESREALEDQERRFQEALARERRDRAADVQLLRDQVADLSRDRAQAVQLATALLADARRLSAAIDAELPHQRYAGGRLDELSRRLDIAEGNVLAGLGEAALAQAQEIYLQLSELRAEVELRDGQWQEARLGANFALSLLCEQIRVNANPVMTDEAGQPMDGVTLDVDFWSEGELSRLREETAALSAAVADEDAPASVAELRRIAEERAPALDERLTEIVTKAHARLLASQVRVNVAELVVNALEESTGYTWADGQACYANGDQRRAFYSKLRHLDDSEIVVEVAPDETGESCVLRILSYEAGLPDDEERARRAHAVADSLRAHGLQAGLPATDGEQADPRLTDFDRLSQPAAQPRRAEQGGAGSVLTRPGRG